jgi:hypothetical protein
MKPWKTEKKKRRKHLVRERMDERKDMSKTKTATATATTSKCNNTSNHH